jgi:hypothetical protein
MMLVNVKLLRLNMNGQESKPVHALAYTKPKPDPMYPPPDSNQCESKECACAFLIICWITFLIWGFIYLLTRDGPETDDDSSRGGGGMHGRLR